MIKLTKTYKDRFLSRIKKLDSCWLWEGTKDGGGYGMFWMNTRSEKAHRISFSLHVGSIPKNRIVCHSCDTPACVNPKHLWLGTYSDNAQDMVRKNRQRKQDGELNTSSKLTKKQILSIRKKYSFRKYSFPQLAKEFKVSFQNIWCIIHKKTWKHLV